VEPAPFVPDEFAVPAGNRTDLFVIEPLQARHNKSDHEAWTSSREHIKITPGFVGHKLWLADAWPFRKPDYAQR